ncbi:MAG: VIT family protein [Lapillicoccus sp.]
MSTEPLLGAAAEPAPVAEAELEGQEAELEGQHVEPHGETGGRLNWLRAAVLGANDGIVSTAGVIVGVAGATAARAPILTAGVAALVAGALSMGVGEYVSVSTQRDTERALLEKERRELQETPDEELAELAGLYHARGLDHELAHQVALQLTAHDALAAHAEVELQIDPDNLTNPWHAAYASTAAFTIGAVLPLLAAVFASPSLRVPLIVVFVVVALGLTGVTSARLGEMAPARQVARNVVGGLLAMVVTYLIGRLVGTAL